MSHGFNSIWTAFLLAATMIALAADGRVAGAAPIVTFTLSLNDNGSGVFTPGDFAVYASDITTGGNQGIESFSADITGYTTITNVSPYHIDRVSDPFAGISVDYYGFSSSRSTNSSPITAAEENPGDPSVRHGFGQTAGNLEVLYPAFDSVVVLGTSPSNVYSAPLLIGTGTFNGTAPSWNDSGANSAELYSGGSVTVSSGLSLATQSLPESGSAWILALGAFALPYSQGRRLRKDPLIA